MIPNMDAPITLKRKAPEQEKEHSAESKKYKEKKIRSQKENLAIAAGQTNGQEDSKANKENKQSKSTEKATGHPEKISSEESIKKNAERKSKPTLTEEGKETSKAKPHTDKKSNHNDNGTKNHSLDRAGTTKQQTSSKASQRISRPGTKAHSKQSAGSEVLQKPKDGNLIGEKLITACIEYAKTSLSNCMKCKKPIPLKCIRAGRVIRTDKKEKKSLAKHEWSHLRCFTMPPNLKSVPLAQIRGFKDLSSHDQAKVSLYLKGDESEIGAKQEDNKAQDAFHLSTKAEENRTPFARSSKSSSTSTKDEKDAAEEDTQIEEDPECEMGDSDDEEGFDVLVREMKTRIGAAGAVEVVSKLGAKRSSKENKSKAQSINAKASGPNAKLDDIVKSKDTKKPSKGSTDAKPLVINKAPRDPVTGRRTSGGARRVLERQGVRGK